ncbi:MAG TPA: hypothetical protein DCP91_03605, partial [Eggerthellaceae bacterium]|nr:hypothetical protein [Eggerthellaceae bacterium]
IRAVYTLRWLDGDESVLQEKTYVEGEPAPVYDGRDPSKAATAQYTYAFTSWDGGTVEGAVTTYRPLFSETVNEYMVRFVNDDGTELQGGRVAYGETPEYKGATPEKPATARCTYTFKGWDKDIVPVTGDATYTATYAETAKKGTLTFDLAGGTIDGKTGTITIEANVGDTIKLPGAPTREGYTFKFWKGSEYEAGADYEVEGDHAFTAEWEKDAPAPVTKHTVSFDANGHGTAPAAQEVEDGKTASKPSDPKADGWTFGGWHIDKSCTKAYDFSKRVTADVTLYAKWTQTSSGTTKGASPNTSSGSSPKTGDDFGGMVAALAATAAGALFLALFAGIWRRKGEQAGGVDRTRR